MPGDAPQALREAQTNLRGHLRSLGMKEPQVIARGDRLVVIAPADWRGERRTEWEEWPVEWEAAA